MLGDEIDDGRFVRRASLIIPAGTRIGSLDQHQAAPTIRRSLDGGSEGTRSG